jgi:hypothetical protein
MSENMEKFRSMDGTDAEIETPYIKITFQHGPVPEVGINGCRVEDVIEVLVQKLLDFQGRDLACEENAQALYHLEMAREAMLLRQKRRLEQGVINTREPHKPATKAEAK